jgi:deoxyribodipyrimidine photo-lyase
MLDWNDSSKLSPWLSIGALSPREIYRQIKLYEAERGANESTYWLTFELLWRDYFRLVAQKKGAALFTAKTSTELSSEQQHERFAAWCAAKTGDDFVDANMNELNLTGWMSNRGRQNVASYLAKTLGVPWQWGASYFEEHLIDYDPCSNWGNWAYLAGVGQDPRNRVFNTPLQASRYDADGTYRRKWKS